VIDKTSPDFRSLCARFGVDWRVIAAIATVESTWDPHVVRFEPNYIYVLKVPEFAKLHRQSQATELALQRMSWGLMQIMGGTARHLGFVDNLTKLLDPMTNLEWGVRYFATLKARYPDAVDDQVAAYNAGRAKRDALTGRHINAHYVEKVFHALEQ
jgi:membrane-bound lytic murein transglycosylase MltF